MKNTIKVCFRIPEPHGANVLSVPETLDRLEQLDLRIAPLADPAESCRGLGDAGALGIALVGSVVGAAAVKGLFDLLQTLLREAGELRRMEATQQHERAIAVLTIAGSTTNLDLDNLESAMEQLTALASTYSKELSK